MKLGMKELARNKGKYSLIITILTLLIFMVLFLSGLANGLAGATSAGIKQLSAKAYIVSEDADDLITRSSITMEDYATLKDENGEEIAGLNLQRMTLKAADADTKLDVTYLALETDEFLFEDLMEVYPSISVESLMEDGDEDWILLDDSFEEDGIQVGDTVLDATTQVEMKVAGFLKNMKYAHSAVGVISTQTYTKIRETINATYEEQYHAVALKDDSVQLESLTGMVQLTKAEIISNIPGHAQEQMTINMILWVLVFVSAAILGVFFYVITIQKLSQFGVMKALGMEMMDISKMVFSQVLLLSGFSMVIGNVLTFAMAAMLPNSMPFILDVSASTLISIVFVVISILCSLLSLGKIRRVDPLMTIGGNE